MNIEKERKAYLKKELKEFEGNHQLSDDERKALHEWVNLGNSVYDNSLMAVGLNYLEEYRDEKYIREATQGMNSEDARKFALAYYGWDDKEPERDPNEPSLEDELKALGY